MLLQTKAMIGHVRQAFLNNLKTLDWMDATTRKQAEEKANGVIEMIGFPEWIKDPTKLDKYYEKVCEGWEVSVDDTTRKQAEEKANGVIEMIGFPEWIKNPTKLDEYYKKVNKSVLYRASAMQMRKSRLKVLDTWACLFLHKSKSRLISTNTCKSRGERSSPPVVYMQ